ncbi:MAG TPA: hypothetical protein PK466_06560 [Thermotogota bacterium]|mgnify:CR=1 FL=1|nr:hypothetical protein [Thermotogota bacterium]HPJ88678.1 hypothetical protein [Thermotogota bacterium]HPR95973.1 hypothetical protein [Thermotogota bacterium]
MSNYHHFEENLKDFINTELKENLKEVNDWVQDATKGKVMMIKLDLNDKDWAVLKELAKIEGKSVQEFTNDAVIDYLRRKSPV